MSNMPGSPQVKAARPHIPTVATQTAGGSSSHAWTHSLDGIAYGGDWSPEQWDADTINNDIALMQEAGVNLVSVGIFSWALLEPTEGHYDFSWLEHILDRLADVGIRVDLATGTASPPAWMAHTYPDTLPVDSHGTRLAFGSRQQYCPSSPVFIEASTRLASQMARHFSSHPAVIMWHISNEYGCHTWECHCAECTRRFRGWLQERYQDIQALNSAWGTAFWSQNYTDFTHIHTPAQMPTFHNPAQLLDWRRFTDQLLFDLYAAEKAAIRTHSDLPVTTNFMGDHPFVDYIRWAKSVDIVSNDCYPDPADPSAAEHVAFNGDLMRSLAGNQPWLLMEQAPGAVQWRTRNSMKRPGQFLLWSLSHLAHGADGILQFQWRQSIQGAETFHSGMVPHSAQRSRTWQEIVETGNILRRLSPIRGSMSQAQVAIVMDWPSMWARHAAIGPVATPPDFARIRAWHRTLWETRIGVDIIAVDDDLSAYRIVIVPGLFIDYPDFSERVAQAVRSGTQVIVEGPTAVVDENLRAFQGGYLGSWKELLGVEVTDHAPLSGPVTHVGGDDTERDALVQCISRSVVTPARHTWLGLTAVVPALERSCDRIASPAPELRAHMWAEYILPLGQDSWMGDCEAEPIALFDGRGGSQDLAHHPAVTRRSCGRGAAWYIACDLDAVSRHAVMNLVCAYTQVRPVLADLPDGVEAVERGEFLFLLNHGDRAVELSGIVGFDLVSGSECRGHVLLSARSAMVVQREERTPQ